MINMIFYQSFTTRVIIEMKSLLGKSDLIFYSSDHGSFYHALMCLQKLKFSLQIMVVKGKPGTCLYAQARQAP